MKRFLDTSVFIAAFWGDHPQHEASVALVRQAKPQSAFCAAHTVAEVYSTMTRLPVKPTIPAEQALLFVEQIYERFTVVSLSDKEYLATIRRLAGLGLSRSLIFDGLITTAAAKCKADQVFTWDVSDFTRVCPPAVAGRIRTP